jgi:hypothetical protein
MAACSECGAVIVHSCRRYVPKYDPRAVSPEEHPGLCCECFDEKAKGNGKEED